MSENPLVQLAELGQSPWYDNIHREMLRSGALARMVQEDGLKGVTSNPTIFDKAMSSGDEYRASMKRLAEAHPEHNVRQHFYALAIEDIRAAADVLGTVYEASGGRDGMVSLEVSPHLARDTQASIAEGRQLFAEVDRPNVMIKIPATREGLPAVEQLISEGINVNVTLLFSVERYVEVVHAYLAGLRRRAEAGGRIDRVASVASFFVSRVDALLDRELEARAAELSGEQRERLLGLRGRLAVANAKVAYRRYQEIFEGAEFAPLAEAGAHSQRLLWASTGTKNPDYSDVLYIDSLIGADTVTTVPPGTYEAFRDHGRVAPTLTEQVDQAAGLLEQAQAAGIDLAGAMQRLEEEGVAAFSKSFDSLLEHLERKLGEIRNAA